MKRGAGADYFVKLLGASGPHRYTVGMKIIGLDSLLFGVHQLDACADYLRAFGLVERLGDGPVRRFEACDGSAIGLAPGGIGCEAVYAVADQRALELGEAELARDRAVVLADGVLHTVDDAGMAIGFRVVRARREPSYARRARQQVRPLALSHIACCVPDVRAAEAFYLGRLGFAATTRVGDAGSFLRPAGSREHHTLFLHQAPAALHGVEHFTFHLACGEHVMQAGAAFEQRGYRSSWGPGRHLIGSNWFWYFDSPLGCKAAYDAEMDAHDGSAMARDGLLTPDRPQYAAFLPPDSWRGRYSLQ